MNANSGRNDFVLENPCEFTVSGTSTLHAWSMTCNAAKGSAKIEVENEKLINISSLELNLIAQNLKSKNKQMDKNAYKALNTDLFPQINFILHRMENIKYKNETAFIGANGILSIAGKQNNITIPVKAKIKKGMIFFEGEVALKLSDYDITPPVFLGTLKTGNEVTVNFKVKFTKNELQTIKTD